MDAHSFPPEGPKLWYFSPHLLADVGRGLLGDTDSLHTEHPCAQVWWPEGTSRRVADGAAGSLEERYLEVFTATGMWLAGVGVMPRLPCGGSIARMVGSGMYSPQSVSSTFCCPGREWLTCMDHVEKGYIQPRGGGTMGEKGPLPPMAPWGSCSGHLLCKENPDDLSLSLSLRHRQQCLHPRKRSPAPQGRAAPRPLAQGPGGEL